MHPQTQNPNEFLNNLTKKCFCWDEDTIMGASDAVIAFNDGNTGRVKVIEHMRINPGENCFRKLEQMDKVRIDKAELITVDHLRSSERRKENPWERSRG